MPITASHLSQAQPPAGLHPLDAQDRATINALLEVSKPTPTDIVHAARLHTRYRDCQLSIDLHPTLLQAVSRWGMDPEQVTQRALGVWSQPGWRPEHTPEQPETSQVGSGADVEGG